MRLTLPLIAILALPACADDTAMPPRFDLAAPGNTPGDMIKILDEGTMCNDGIGDALGACAHGLICCRELCPPSADACLDSPSYCRAACP
jgi:hypothetical protein